LEVALKPHQWLQSRDTGTSSKTIFYVMTGAVTETGLRCEGAFDIPYDPADFGRCYRLLDSFPEWRNRLGDVAKTFPKWGPLVENWKELENLYRQEYQLGKAPLLYARMRQLYPDCMVAEGWRRTGENSYFLPELSAT